MHLDHEFFVKSLRQLVYLEGAALRPLTIHNMVEQSMPMMIHRVYGTPLAEIVSNERTRQNSRHSENRE